MLLVVFQAVKIKIHFGELLLSALLLCQRINHDMLWSEWLDHMNRFLVFKIISVMLSHFAWTFRELVILLILLFVVLWVLICMTACIPPVQHALALLSFLRWPFFILFIHNLTFFPHTCTQRSYTRLLLIIVQGPRNW